MNLTYRQLLAELQTFTDEQLDCNVSVYDCDNEEYYPLQPEIAFATEDCQVLDPNHPILYI